MKLSRLNNLFNSSIIPEDFKSDISKEVAEYRKKLEIKGTSVALNIQEDSSLYFTQDKLIKLCVFYIDQVFTGTEISYISDCLTLSDSVSFENEELEEILDEIVELEAIGKLNREEALSIIDRLH